MAQNAIFKIMKTYELNNQAAINRAEAQVTEKTIYDLYKEVKAGNIVPVTDDQENIIGFNCVKPKPSTMKVCKLIDGHLTTGDTEDDRLEDEIALRKFTSEYPVTQVQEWFEAAMLIIKSGYEPDDIVVSAGEIYLVYADKKQVTNMENEVIVDLSTDEDLIGASQKLIIKLLKAALNSEF